MTLAEEWLELPEDPRYLVSSHGRFYSTVTNRFIAPAVAPRKDGGNPRLYYRVILPGCRRRNIYAAVAVLTLFHGPAPSPWYAVEYIDGNPRNVRLDNLRWRPRFSRDHMRRASRSRHWFDDEREHA